MENTALHARIVLADLQPGQSARILSLKNLNPAFRQRLMAMGVVSGAEVTLIRRAPLGCPLEFACGSTRVCVRAHEIAAIQAVRLVDEHHA